MSLDTLLDMMESEENADKLLKKLLQNNDVTFVTPEKSQVLQKNILQNNGVTLVTPVTPKKSLSVEKSVFTRIQKATTLANYIGEEDHYVVLNKYSDSEALTYSHETEHEREKRRQKVLSMLAENPHKKRAYVTDTSIDPDNVFLTIAILGLATFEMRIPRSKYDPFLFVDMINKEISQ